MFRRLVVAALALLTTGIVTEAEARKRKGPARDREVVIGKLTLDPAGTSATIDVSAAKGAFKAIRVRAVKGPIEFSGLRIVYNDDSFHAVDKQFKLSRGERTRALDERDADRFVDTVFVNYKGDGKPMVVEIAGVQTRDGAKLVRTKPATPAAVATAAPAPAAAPPAAPVTETPAVAPAPVAPVVAAAPPAPPPPKPKPVIADPKSIREGHDVMFGYQTVSLATERQNLRVGSEVGKFHALRLRVLDADIHVNEMEVFYSDGTSQVLYLDASVKSGQKSKWYVVNGKELIKDVQLALRAKPNAKGVARVELVGQYAEGWLGAEGEGRKFNRGWVLLGSETAGSVGFDKEVVSVGDNSGKFSRLLLQVRERSITLREIRVVYQNGQDEVIRTNDRVDPDGTAGPWDLAKGQEAVKEIVAVYRRPALIGRGEGTAVVEFWGQH